MSRLAKWMTREKETDETLAKKVGVSRVQITRIRCGSSGASRMTAEKLQELTGIPWHSFIEPKAVRSKAERDGAAA